MPKGPAPTGSSRSLSPGPWWSASGAAFGLRPQRLAGDTVYGAVRLLKWLVDRQDRAAHPGLGQVGTLRWHLQPRRLRLRSSAQRLHLPGWKAAAHHRNSHRRQYASLSCLKARLRSSALSKCSAAPTRLRGKIPRDLHEDARDVARALAKTEAFEQSRRERKKVEMRFAHMKRIFRLDRLRLRGLSGVKDEVLLTATAQNLRRLVKFLCRPPPAATVTCLV